MPTDRTLRCISPYYIDTAGADTGLVRPGIAELLKPFDCRIIPAQQKSPRLRYQPFPTPDPARPKRVFSLMAIGYPIAISSGLHYVQISPWVRSQNQKLGRVMAALSYGACMFFRCMPFSF